MRKLLVLVLLTLSFFSCAEDIFNPVPKPVEPNLVGRYIITTPSVYKNVEFIDSTKVVMSNSTDKVTYSYLLVYRDKIWYLGIDYNVYILKIVPDGIELQWFGGEIRPSVIQLRRIK